MDLQVGMRNEPPQVDCVKLHKMAFVFNAIQDGWTVRLSNNAYIFTKKHEGKKEIYLDTYLRAFVEKNMDINALK